MSAGRERRIWGPAERAVMDLALDPGSDAQRVARAIAAFDDGRSWGRPELTVEQIARRASISSERVTAALEALVLGGHLQIGPGRRDRPRAGARRFRLRNTTEKRNPQ